MSSNTLSLSPPKQVSTNDDESLQSPNAMAEAALAAAIVERKNDARNQALDSCTNCEDVKGIHLSSSFFDAHGDHLNDDVPKKRQRILITDDKGTDKSQRQEKKQVSNDIDSVWNFLKMKLKNNQSIREKSEWALKKTEQVLNEELDIVFKIGVNAFHQCGSLERELKHVKDLANTRQLEIKRLQTSYTESRATVSVSLEKIQFRDSKCQLDIQKFYYVVCMCVLTLSYESEFVEDDRGDQK